MKHKKNFEEWFNIKFLSKAVTIEDDIKITYYKAYLIEAWEACENMYETRTCEGCKYYNNNFCINDGLFDKKAKNILVSKDFCCKYWDAK